MASPSKPALKKSPASLNTIFLHPHALLTRGFDDTFLAPHSRYADFPAALIRDYTDLEILAETEEGDAYLFASKDKRIAFVTGHPEYDANTLAGSFSAMWKRGSVRKYRPIISRMMTHKTHRGQLEKSRKPAVCQLAELLCLPNHAIRSAAYESDSGLILQPTRS
ncbi:Homoserine O-succinyltransferase [Raoultella terrigena]|uniref:Homoserine O-succinyltransferase n=1 Tax=Raoultella terrigena TaxID=577 RepID=A0A485CX16_RAOTE|nr:Homoserine O-succinyltransferase [Raoultella terrigena]